MSGRLKHVAVVDDDEAVLEATSGFLESLGYSTVTFGSGRAFLDFEGKADVGCLLTDIHMPGMSGLELQGLLRRDYPDIAIIMMSALTDKAVRQQAIAGGAKDLLPKPLVAEALIPWLDEAMGPGRD